MTWSLAGWVFIGVATILLVSIWVLFTKRGGYPARELSAVEALKNSQNAAIERGQRRQVVLGHQLWSHVYPGLGLQALAVSPSFIDPEAEADGGLSISGADGSLVVFARQIIHRGYRDGFSLTLHKPGVRVLLPGTTPLTFVAGLLPQLHTHHSLALIGNYGPEVLLWTETVAASGGHVFAAAGSLASQAGLFLSVRDLLIGEEVFMVSGLLEKSAGKQAGILTEDILRAILILLLISASILKMLGIL